MQVVTDAGGRSFEIELDVRWSDQDHLGHVNHVVAVGYLAEARLRWLAQHATGEGHTDFHSPRVVVSLSIDYLDAMFAGSPLTIAMRVVHIGTKSYTLSYEARQAGALKMTASTVLVTAGEHGVIRPITVAERAYLANFQQPPPSRLPNS